NKAFEKIGFRNAIEVRQQEDRDDFDPEDMGYATFRWVTNEQTFAIGPSRVNPLTGEILDADILFDASMVRFEKADYRVYRNEKGEFFEPASEMQAARRGWSIPTDPLARLRGSWNDKAIDPTDTEAVWRAKMKTLRSGLCQCAAHKTSELSLAALALAPGKEGDKVPEELVLQAIKETVMHEVGHTLGLRHNFKASTMVPNDKLHDKEFTAKGLVGSIMDYNPANIAGKGQKQGYYFSPTIGAYDYWAIEYAYKPNASDEDLAKIGSRAAEPTLTFATDEDLMGTADPLVNQWDLGSDPLKFAQDRVKMAQDLLPKVAEGLIDNGEGYQRTRAAFQRLLQQYGTAAMIGSQFVGGEAVHRDHKGDPNARDPMVPVTAAKQREALKFVSETLFTDKNFEFSPELLRKLAPDRWSHWGNDQWMRRVDFDLNNRILGLQRVALNELFNPATLKRVQENALKAKKDETPLAVSEIFRVSTDSIYAGLPDAKDKLGKSSVVKRNLQRAYVQKLSDMVLGPKGAAGGFNALVVLLGGGGGGATPPDAKALARLHLKEIGTKIDAALAQLDPKADDTVKAHLSEQKELITKVLSAAMTVNE
ncbi:MAG: zinc-dependent metalloprotease, partial [Gemmataceae bacterium]